MPPPDEHREDDSARWRRVRVLVEAALEQPASLRAHFLATSDATAAARDDAMRWLAACEEASDSADFLARPAAERAAPFLPATPQEPTTADASDLTASDTFRRALGNTYAIEREVGRGGMATVFLASDLRHHRSVAVKVLHPELTATLGGSRFLREIALTASLQHPHILPLFDSGDVEGALYYVMPYVEGETLQTRLARERQLRVPDVVRLAREVSSALSYAHRRGVVHRDIKPANILLTDGHAVVADFGIARAVLQSRAAQTSDAQGDATGSHAAQHAAHDDGALTAAGSTPGTPAYMAPEQARAGVTVDHRADLYALGVVLYEALAGVHPFDGRAPHSMLAAQLAEVPEPIAARRPDVPPALAALVMRLLAKDPADRPQSADEVLRSLDDDSEAPAVWTPRRLTSVAAAAVLIASVVVYATRRDAPTVAPRESPGASRVAVDPARVGGAIRTVAVIPFASTDGAGDDYFSDGMTDELAHALARLPGLRITGRTSSYTFKGRSATAQEIGRALDVGAFVNGTVRRAAGRLRVTTQLVNASDGKVMWDGVYESRSKDVFAVQDTLAREIVAALSPSLGVSIAAQPRAASRGTADQEAYELYLKGRYHWLQRGVGGVTQAIAYFKRSIARDSMFAAAHAGLAMAYSTLPNYVPDASDSATALTLASARRAISLDSSLADAQLALGITLDGQLRFREALARYRAAVASDPSSATGHHWLGMSLLNLGRTNEALVELRQATELDPLAPTPAGAFALALLYARRFAEARDAAHRALELDSTFAFAIWPLGMAQTLGGQPDSGVRTFQRGVRLQPGDSRMTSGLLLAYAAEGHWDEVQHLRRELHLPGRDRSGWADAAVADLVVGDREPLVRVLTTRADQRRYIRAGALLGCNPLLDPLWSDARFRAAMRVLTVEACDLSTPSRFPRLPTS